MSSSLTNHVSIEKVKRDPQSRDSEGSDCVEVTLSQIIRTPDLPPFAAFFVYFVQLVNITTRQTSPIDAFSVLDLALCLNTLAINRRFVNLYVALPPASRSSSPFRRSFNHFRNILPSDQIRDVCLLLYLDLPILLLVLKATMSSSSSSSSNDGRQPRRFIIPAVRRCGYQSIEPWTLPTVPDTPAATQARRAAFRNQVRYPFALDEGLVDSWLERYGWDVNQAVAGFWDSENQAPGQPVVHRNQSDPAPPFSRPLDRDAPRPTSLEASRIQYIQDMLLSIEAGSDARLRAIIPVIATIYNNNHWLLSETMQEIGLANGGYTSILRKLLRLSHAPTGQLERDERLARFIDITATNSYYSALRFLQIWHWNLPMAIDVWFREGGLPIVFPPLPRRASSRPIDDDGLRHILDFNRPYRIVNGYVECLDLERVTFVNNLSARRIRFSPPASEINDDDRVEWARTRLPSFHIPLPSRIARGTDPVPRRGRDSLPSNTRGARGPQRSHIVNTDRSPAVVHCPDPSKLYVEYFRNGQYYCVWFDGSVVVNDPVTGQLVNRNFRWEDEEANDADEEVEFDWHNHKHIARLNKWRNNLLVQQTARTVRAPVGADFNKYEKQWLIEQVAMLVEEKYFGIRGNTQKGRDKAEAIFSNPNKFPVSLSSADLDSLTDRFNRTFAGESIYEKTILRSQGLSPNTPGAMKYTKETVQKDMSLTSEVPRPPRTKLVIGQQRFRIPTLAKHFMYKYAYLKGGDIDDFKDEADSDFGDDVGSNGNGGTSILPGPVASLGRSSGSTTQLPAVPPSYVPFPGQGVIYAHDCQQLADREEREIDARRMTRESWGRVLGLMEDYHRTSQGHLEQRIFSRFLAHFGLNAITDLGSRAEIRGLILARLPTPAVAPSVPHADPEEPEEVDESDLDDIYDQFTGPEDERVKLGRDCYHHETLGGICSHSMSSSFGRGFDRQRSVSDR